MSRLRSALTALGVIIGIVAVTLMGTAIRGIDAGVDRSFSGFGDERHVAQHRLARRDAVRVTDLDGEPLILPRRDLQCDVLAEACHVIRKRAGPAVDIRALRLPRGTRASLSVPRRAVRVKSRRRRR